MRKFTQLSDRSIVHAVFFSLAVTLLCLAVAAGNQNPSWPRYYPLARGNTWRYSITSPSEPNGKKSVTWRVVNQTTNEVGFVFAVWPTPSDADDVGMQLQPTNEGLMELQGDFYLLRFPIKKGQMWDAKGERTFSVISEGSDCSVGKRSFSRCAVIEDQDKRTHVKTLTTYAYDVGPVKFEYYAIQAPGSASAPTQILDIVSYSVKP